MINKKIFSVLICIILIMLSGCSRKSTFKTEYIVNEFADTNDLLRNPGKGLVVRGWCDPSYDTAYYEMCSVSYERFEWAAVEPVEGQYEWDLIDRYINEASKHGLKFAFGIMNAAATSENIYVTPKWVFDAGAQGTFFTANTGNYIICPDWNDSIYLDKVNSFIKALAERYDGNENIAYIDIRSFGNYGEQHLYGLEGSNYSYISSEQFKENYIMPYRNAFQNTLLVNACNGDLYTDVYEWAVNQGMALRRDGILGYSDGKECIMAYGKVPAIYEFGNTFSYYKEHNMWDMNEIKKCIDIGKPSYLELTYDAYKESAEDFRKFANMIGYHFRIKSATLPKAITRNSPLNIKLSFINDGVAYLYENALLKIGIFDQKGNLVKDFSTKENPKKWEPGVKKEVSLKIDSAGLSIGDYTIAIGLFANEKDDVPKYQFGSEGNRGDNWYSIGTVSIVNKKNYLSILSLIDDIF